MQIIGEESHSGAAIFGDQRLKTIRYTKPAADALVSQNSYDYDSVGRIAHWTMQRADWANPRQWSLSYDDADQLRGGTFADTVTGEVFDQGEYAYDAAGNRVLSQENGVTKLGTFNNLNQLLTLQTGAVPIPVRASVNKVVTNPTINGQPAAVTYSATGVSLSGSVTLPPGTNTATDPSPSQPLTKT